MGKAENRIEAAVCNYAEQKGFLVRKYNAPGVQGVPDRIFWGHGQCFLIEFKAPGGKLSAQQDREIGKLREHGATVFVVEDISYGETLIDGALISAGVFPDER